MTENIYPIRYVSEKTGIKPVTLRAWETRYKLLKPHRTEKGHRLYSQDDLDKINRIVALINKGATISQAIESLINLSMYELISDNEHKFLINFDALKNAVKNDNYQVAIKEINCIYADYSPEAFAQVIYPALYKELANNIWPYMSNAEINREIILDLIINRLMTNINENNYHSNQKTIQVIGFRTGMIKSKVIEGLFIANVLKAHGHRVVFCSGVSNINAISTQININPTIIFTSSDNFYAHQIVKELYNSSMPVFIWAKDFPENLEGNVALLKTSFTLLYDQIKIIFR
ncbi:MAG: DNA-binding transcriptional MerR regulator [Francisellaceae bacterium]|jgi:DNA-binding transcriptional MerR regulator